MGYDLFYILNKLIRFFFTNAKVDFLYARFVSISTILAKHLLVHHLYHKKV